jgi:tryptophan synthase alpha chain
MSRIAETFQRLKSQKRAAFIPFFAAGDPDMAATAALIKDAEAAGADIVEIGVPFSDPIADGPVIQAAFYRALEKGFRVSQLFELVKSLRRDGLKLPLVCMVSNSLVYKRTDAVFFAACREAGFDGVIIPDLPAGYEGDASERAAAAGLDLIFLVAPTTPPERRQVIAQRSRGFIYYISVTGITGARTALPADLEQNIRDLKSRSTTPVCVGFGISLPEQARAVAALADGVIIGSAVVRKVEQAMQQKLAGRELVQHVGSLLRDLAAAAHNSGPQA